MAMRRAPFLLFLLFSANAVARPCPFALSKITTRYLHGETLCSIYDRYQSATSKLNQKGITPPERIADVRAPRFINKTTWKDKSKEHNYSPWFIYKPVPTTWAAWEFAAQFIENESRDNFEGGRFEPIDKSWLMDLFSRQMTGLLSSKSRGLRQGNEWGLYVYKSRAATRAETLELSKGGGLYIREAVNGAATSWTPTICHEQKKTEWKSFNPPEWEVLSSDKFFSSNGQSYQCGYVTYPRSAAVEPLLASWLTRYNDENSRLASGESRDDLFLYIAKIQRFFVEIHPFTDGNGRMSRFMMDHIFLSLGLPAPVIDKMDADMSITEDEWAQRIADGILSTVKITETCAASTDHLGCNIVSLTPEVQK